MQDVWRMRAVNDLQTLNAKKQALVNIPEQIEELESKLTAIRSATAGGTPVKGGGSGREDMFLNIFTDLDDLRESLKQTEKDVAKIERSLSVLTNTERKILQVKFIEREPCAITKLASELNIDERTVRNKQADALKQFAMAMRGSLKL